MIRALDPASMAPADRLAELAEVLAVGYLRLLVSREKELDQAANGEALCLHTVNKEETVRKEFSRWKS